MSTKVMLSVIAFMTTVFGIGFYFAERKGNIDSERLCIIETQKLKDENSALKLDYLVLLARYDHQDK